MGLLGAAGALGEVGSAGVGAEATGVAGAADEACAGGDGPTSGVTGDGLEPHAKSSAARIDGDSEAGTRMTAFSSG